MTRTIVLHKPIAWRLCTRCHRTEPCDRLALCGRCQRELGTDEDPAQAGLLVLDLRLYRRSPADVSELAFTPTAAGFRVPAHLSDLVGMSVQSVGRRAVEQHATRGAGARG